MPGSSLLCQEMRPCGALGDQAVRERVRKPGGRARDPPRVVGAGPTQLATPPMPV